MKKLKKIAVTLAVVLLVGCVIGGTLAFLKDDTETVTNTFVAAGGPGPFVETFELKEYKVEQSSTGKYNQTEEEVIANTYGKVMPGTVIPKEVFVKLSRTGVTQSGETVTPAPAYLYLEVVDGLDKTEYTWSVNTDWQKLGSVTAADGTSSDIYLYVGALADSNNVLTTVAAGTTIDVITGNCVEVEDVELTAGEFKLSFNAYLAQASTGSTDDPAEVFKACFNKTITPVSIGNGN